MAHLGFLMHAYFGCAAWHDDEPYCSYCAERPQFDSAETVVLLALFSVTGELSYLARSRIRNCPKLLSYDRDDLVGYMWPTMVEVFMLLHEYGHILKNHLDPHAVRPDDIDGVG